MSAGDAQSVVFLWEVKCNVFYRCSMLLLGHLDDLPVRQGQPVQDFVVCVALTARARLSTYGEVHGTATDGSIRVQVTKFKNTISLFNDATPKPAVSAACRGTTEEVDHLPNCIGSASLPGKVINPCRQLP